MQGVSSSVCRCSGWLQEELDMSLTQRGVHFRQSLPAPRPRRGPGLARRSSRWRCKNSATHTTLPRARKLDAQQVPLCGPGGGGRLPQHTGTRQGGAHPPGPAPPRSSLFLPPPRPSFRPRHTEVPQQMPRQYRRRFTADQGDKLRGGAGQRGVIQAGVK